MSEVLVYRRRIPEEKVEGKPLGRHVHFDSRSALYPFRPAVIRDLTSVLWHRDIGVLNQGNLGSCTGNALTGAIGTDPLYAALPAGHAPLDETLAVKIYSLATSLDSFPGAYPPTDTGSDGIDACKAGVKLGLISGYTHSTDLASMQQAVMEGPVIIGINWYSSFDNPDPSNGTVTISSGAYVRGGHEVEVIGMDPGTKMFLAENSWGPEWGYNGTFQFSFDVMTRLFTEEGDCTVPLPLTATPPQPPPAPEPAALDRELELAAIAGPWADQTRVRSDLVKLKAAIRNWESRAGIAYR